MKNTLYLVAKDFRLLFSQLMLGLFLGTVSGLSVSMQMPMMAFVVIMLLLGYYTCVQGFYVEEKNDTMTLLGALPVQPNQIVLSKYLGFFVSTVLSLGTIALLTLAGSIVQSFGGDTRFLPTVQSLATDWVALPIGFFIGAVFTSIMIPPIAKLGVMKARWLLFGVYFITFTGIGWLTNAIVSIAQIQQGALTRIASMFAPNQPLSYVALVLAGLLILWLSYMLTCRIYAQKRIKGR